MTFSNMYGANQIWYAYDGDGRRVGKFELLVLSPTSTDFRSTIYARDAFGNTVAEYCSPDCAYGALGTTYYTTDVLGSTRVETDAGGNVKRRYDYLPFGQEIPAQWPAAVGTRTVGMRYQLSASTDAMPAAKFTGKERDAETGLDYFGARYFSGAQGRFTSPDAPLIDQHLEDPQSWNLYGYGRNNPLRYADSDGRAATVTIETDEEHKRGTVKISATVAVYAAPGSKLSASQVAAAGEALKKSVESTWAGYYSKDGINYTVSTDIKVSVVGNEKAGIESGAQNVIGLSNGPAGRGGDSFVADRGAFQNYDTGVFNINAITAAGSSSGAHEWGHLLGGGDLFRGFGGQLMNTDPAYRDGTLTGADFRSVFGSAIDDHRGGSRQTYFGLVPYGAPRSTTTQRVLKGMWSSRLGF